MYIVRNKATRQIIHVNPAPLMQALEGTDIYYQYDPSTMEIGKGEFPVPPEHFDIDAQGFILPWTLQQEVDAGVRTLPPGMKAIGNRIVEKSVSEKVAEGLIVLKPTEKLVDDAIVLKSLPEQVAAGLIQLGNTQILDGDQIREMSEAEKVMSGLLPLDPYFKIVDKRLVQKSRADLARENMVHLSANEKIVGDEVITLTPRQMFNEGRYNLETYKRVLVEQHSQANLAARRRVVPDHELLYAALGELDASLVGHYREVVSTFLKALDDAKVAINEAGSANLVETIVPDYEKIADDYIGAPGRTR